jgi:steroid 5-alpha reductase family enzyme
LLFSALGFYRLVYFVSVGYAFSIAAMAAALALTASARLTWATGLQLLLLIGWGLRLGGYLLWRDLTPSFHSKQAEIQALDNRTPISRKMIVWIGVSILYLLMFSPALAHGLNAPAGSSRASRISEEVGLALMIAGLAIEALADRQKSAFKARHPSGFCKVGLYAWVRSPNYLGEITFWVGNWVSGLFFFNTGWYWVAGLSGLTCIVLIMIGSTKRLERSQGERYGSLAEFQEYVTTVPVLFPFVPVYTLKKVRVFLE